ncbi:MAG: 4-hydroxythreonine-4-phosphate dehydrogenase PdxA [Alphaproteobacteria bacterium]|nr:4-hydroxythreonine-4-phosphate dehydrogenase PdxA [Alphaproteobacteria bacterium]
MGWRGVGGSRCGHGGHDRPAFLRLHRRVSAPPPAAVSPPSGSRPILRPDGGRIRPSGADHPDRCCVVRRAGGLTIGTPVLFSSVAHGSALDIAGQGKASHAAIVEAVERRVGAAHAKAA